MNIQQKIECFFHFGIDFCVAQYYIFIVGYKKEGRYAMSPKRGRPTSEPKDKFLKLRVSQKDLDKLNYVAEKTNTTKTDVIRKGINLQYEELMGK